MALPPLLSITVTEKEELLVLFLMTVLSQTFFAFVRSDFMTLSLLTTRHTLSNLVSE
jgi:hypothetical protein